MLDRLILLFKYRKQKDCRQKIRRIDRELINKSKESKLQSVLETVKLNRYKKHLRKIWIDCQKGLR